MNIFDLGVPQSPSQRLRTALCLLWRKQADAGVIDCDFETYYVDAMEAFVASVQKQLAMPCPNHSEQDWLDKFPALKAYVDSEDWESLTEFDDDEGYI